MQRLTGRRPTPDDVAAVALEPGERRLTWGRTVGGDPVVATDLGLHLPGAERLDWPDIERAGWKRPALTVVRVAEIEGSGDRVAVQLVEEGELPELIRTRVTASIGWTSHYRLVDAAGRAAGVRVVGRRRPGQDLLAWQVVYDKGTDVSDPVLRAEAEQYLLDAQRTVG